jgi:hypothetical protein
VLKSDARGPEQRGRCLHKQRLSRSKSRRRSQGRHALKRRRVHERGTGKIDSCVGPNMTISNIRNCNIVQVSPQTQNNFNATGSALMSFQSPESVSFTESRMRCTLPQCAAFRQHSDAPSASITDYSCKPCPPFEISLAAKQVSLEQLSDATNAHCCSFPSRSFCDLITQIHLLAFM